MTEKYIFTMLGLNKFYGQKQVLRDINLCFFPGAKIGIVGENGAGKSTVLNIMAGSDDEFDGKAFITSGFRSGIVKQDPDLDSGLTVRETLELAFSETAELLREYNDLAARMGEEMSDDEMQKAIDRMGQLQDKIDAADAWNLDQVINMASNALCLPEDDRVVKTLSGGEKRRVALCKALLERPDLLLLDEPTNHLDAETVQWLEEQLKDYPGTVIIVTHDRYFLDNVTKWILELEAGYGIPYEGNYSSWIEQKLGRLAAQEKKESPRARMLSRELAWLKMSIKDRRSMSRVRIAEYEQMLVRSAAEGSDDGSVIQISPGPSLGDQVIEFKSVSKKYDETDVFSDATFSIPRGAVVGLVGPNGTGKTTMFKMIVGQEQPTSGHVIVGSTVKVAHIDQERETLSGDMSLIDEIGGGVTEIAIGNRSVPIRQYLARFGFRSADQQKTVGELSGGERNRCNLAKILKVGGNVILLDEPTNDLDVNTLRMLEEAIMGFAGTILVISHDRYFLDRICTHLIVFEGVGAVRWFDGNFKEYEEHRRGELGDKLLENRRLKYRRLIKI
jgi:ATP-binding cassette ChvD family protein